MEKPRYLEQLEKIEAAIADARTHIGEGTEGSVPRAAVSIGQAVERARQLRYALWDDFEPPTDTASAPSSQDSDAEKR